MKPPMRALVVFLDFASVRWLAGLASLLVAGCVNSDPGSAFTGVENEIAARSGARTKVRWNLTPADDAETRHAVGGLLGKPLTAQSAAQIALLNNRSLQAEFEKIGIAHADYIQAGLLGNPQFSASWRFPNRPPFGTDAEYALAGSVLDLFLLPARRKAAAAELEQTGRRAAAQALGLIAETKAAVYTLQARQQLLGKLRQIVETNEAAADLARRQHEAGNISDLDFATQQAASAQGQVDVLQTQAQLRADRERVNRLLGLSEDEETRWRTAGQLPAIPSREPALKNLETLAIAQRLDLAAARQNADAIGQALALRTKTRYLPLGLKLGVNTERDSDRQRVTGPTLDLELPIFDQGQGAIAKLAAQYRQARRQWEAAETNARSEVRAARDLVAARRQIVETYRSTLLPQQRAVTSDTQLQYNAMTRGAYDLLGARERELSVERAHIEAWRDYWLARVELERALAGGIGGLSSGGERGEASLESSGAGRERGLGMGASASH
jgi:cobalt-zinc-cadmium efflux system outer membrane protein